MENAFLGAVPFYDMIGLVPFVFAFVTLQIILRVGPQKMSDLISPNPVFAFAVMVLLQGFVAMLIARSLPVKKGEKPFFPILPELNPFARGLAKNFLTSYFVSIASTLVMAKDAELIVAYGVLNAAFALFIISIALGQKFLIR
jgi:hypothetical protein